MFPFVKELEIRLTAESEYQIKKGDNDVSLTVKKHNNTAGHLGSPGGTARPR